MNEQIRLGRIAGIPIGANWSVLVVLWLIAWSLASQQLPTSHPGQPTSAYWVIGSITAVVFMACLLAHELGHSLVAKHFGLTVERITLWLFGGVATLRDEAPTPRVELLVSIAGPAVSVGLGCVFGATSVILDAAGSPPLHSAAAGWLAAINLMLAVFNLIPAAPLDGGRVLHAALWMRHGDRLRATGQAVNAGKVFGYTLVGLGFFQFAAGAGIGGLWLVFLGWFLLNAANAEASDALLRESLKGVTVGQVMTPNPVTAPTGIDAGTFLDRYVMAHRASAFPLVDAHGAFAGLVTLSRLKEVPAERRSLIRIEELACAPADVPTPGPEEPLVEVLNAMSAATDHRAVVMVDGHIVGIVTPTDVTRTVQLAALRRSA